MSGLSFSSLCISEYFFFPNVFQVFPLTPFPSSVHLLRLNLSNRVFNWGCNVSRCCLKVTALLNTPYFFHDWSDNGISLIVNMFFLPYSVWFISCPLVPSEHCLSLVLLMSFFSKYISVLPFLLTSRALSTLMFALLSPSCTASTLLLILSSTLQNLS